MFRLVTPAGALRFEEVPEPSRTVEQEAEVRRVWSSHCSTVPTAHNDWIYSVVSYDETTIVSCRTMYRNWHSQVVTGQWLGIRPLAVSGLVATDMGYIMGRRSDHVLQDPGQWEFAPAGGVSAIDEQPLGSNGPWNQLEREGREELGLGSGRLRSPRLLGIVEDMEVGVVNLVYFAVLEVRGADLNAWATMGEGHEYTEVGIIPRDSVEGLPGGLSPSAAFVQRTLAWPESP